MLLLLYQDGRLRSGDHILRIGDTDLLGMGSEQVAQVLRQCGNRVKLVVTRGPVDEGSSGSAVMPVVLPTVSEQQVKHERLFSVLVAPAGVHLAVHLCLTGLRGRGGGRLRREPDQERPRAGNHHRWIRGRQKFR